MTESAVLVSKCIIRSFMKLSVRRWVVGGCRIIYVYFQRKPVDMYKQYNHIRNSTLFKCSCSGQTVFSHNH